MKKIEKEVESEEEQPQRRNTKTKGYARSYAVTERWFKAAVAAATIAKEVEAKGEIVVKRAAEVERSVAAWWPKNHGSWNQYLMLILGILAVIGIFQICGWIREFLCEKRCGTKGCCKKREVTVETVEKVEEEIEPFDLHGTVYITERGNCFHRYRDCHSLKFAKVQKREPCTFCEREFARVQETAAFLMKDRVDKEKRELESRMAQTGRKSD